MRKSLALIPILLFLTPLVAMQSATVSAQIGNNSPIIEWQRYLPGITGTSVIQTSDGGYLVLGQDAIIDTTLDQYVNYTSVAVKTDSSGNTAWAKTYSVVNGITETRLTFAVEANDGYVLAGLLAPGAYQFPERFCLIKINFNGEIVWNKTYSREILYESLELGGFIKTNDGGYALIGSYSGSAPSPSTLIFFKFDSAGNQQWNKTLASKTNIPNPLNPSNSLSGRVSYLAQTNDSGYLIIGTVGFRPISPISALMIKIDSTGDVQWVKTYGGGDNYYHTVVFSAIAVDDGYLIAGAAAPSGMDGEGFIIKTDYEGNMMWNRTYPNIYRVETMSKAKNGELIFLGTILEALPNYRYREYVWVWQIDNLGNILQQSEIIEVQSGYFSNPSPLVQALDGGYVFTGVFNWGGYNLINGQLTPDDKFWIIKTSEFQPNSTSTPEFQLWIIPILLAIMISIGLLVYFKKHKNMSQT